MAKSQWFVDPLYARMRDDLHLTGMSENTRKAYLRQIRKLSDIAQASPDRITEDQLRAYFLHLKNDLNFAYGSLRVAFSGIKFFFTVTCKRDWETLRQMRLQNVTTLPDLRKVACDPAHSKDISGFLKQHPARESNPV